MQSTFNQSGNKSVIMLEGDLTLPHAKALKDIFTKALQESDHVSVGLENVHNVDLSCLQLFCSAHRSAVRMKKQIMFHGNLPGVLKSAAEAAGYNRLKGCTLACEKSCLWMAMEGDHHE